MARVTPQQAREKHARNLKAASQDITNGVNAVTVAPGQQAAAKQNKMLNNLTEAVNSGKWARRVASVPLQEWQQKMLTKGLPRISSGVDAAAGKIEAFFGELLPYQDTLKQQISTMPDLTLDDNIQRMVKFVSGMSKFRRNG